MGEKQVAVVAGGTGSIGEGVVKALLEAGYLVYVPVRKNDKIDRLIEYTGGVPELRSVEADLCDEAAIAAMRDRILKEEGRIDAVVVSVGSGYFGHSLHRMPREDWDNSIRDNLATHFNTQRIFIEYFRQRNEGVYVTLVGPEAENILPDAGMVSVMAAAQKMMTRVLAAEAEGTGVRVHALTALTTINTRNRGENFNQDWITARELGHYAVGLIGGQVPGATETLHDLKDASQVSGVVPPGRSSDRFVHHVVRNVH
jgi:3-oxoacyl-[acyl-carrier protein] reductase